MKEEKPEAEADPAAVAGEDAVKKANLDPKVDNPPETPVPDAKDDKRKAAVAKAMKKKEKEKEEGK